MSRFRQCVIQAGMSLALVGLAAFPTAAQTSAITGTVYRDTLDNPLNGVEVTIDAANRKTLTNYAGEFRISDLPPGHYIIGFRHLGFTPLADTVVIAAGRPVDREYVMAVQPVTLGSVLTTETNAPPKTQYGEFLERLEHHNGGHFIDAAVLEKNQSRKMEDLLMSVIPGLTVYQPNPMQRPTWEYVSSGRGACNGPVFTCGGGSPCPVALYIDGVPVFSPGPSGSDTRPVPDLSTYNTGEYAGVEYYADGASLPPRYNATTNTCGVLLLWTRTAMTPW